MGRDRGRRWLLLGLGLALTAGCSSNEPARRDNNEPLPKVTHAKAEVPKDRDEQSVIAAMRQLDACALLGPEAKVNGFPASVTPRSRAPHRCEVVREEGQDEVLVILGDLLDVDQRYHSELLSVGGAKAYLAKYRDECWGYLPVSFRLSIKFVVHKGVRSSTNDLCAPAKGFLQYAVNRLAEPDRLKPGQSMPMADWDACQLLTAALGDNSEGLKLAVNRSALGIDSCGAAKEGPESASPPVHLQLEYDRDPVRETSNVRTIAGKQVRVYDQSDYCSLAWSNGKVSSAQPNDTDQVVEIKAQDCKRGEAMVTAAMKRLRDAPSTGAKPQRPITYRADEPDRDVPGACADLGPRPVCEPYVEVSVPSGSKNVLRAAEADPNVYCAIAKEAVATHFGDALKPVTAAARCVFVEPTHSVQLFVSATEFSAETGDTSRTVAGHHAYLKRTDRGNFGTDHVLGVSVGEHGLVKFTATFTRKRGAEGDARIDDSLSSKLQPLATDVMTKYFAG